MEETTDYQIVAAAHLTDLVDEVRGLIEKGWEPIGGAAFDRYEHEPRAGHGIEEAREYIQAMIKRHSPRN